MLLRSCQLLSKIYPVAKHLSIPCFGGYGLESSAIQAKLADIWTMKNGSGGFGGSGKDIGQ